MGFNHNDPMEVLMHNIENNLCKEIRNAAVMEHKFNFRFDIESRAIAIFSDTEIAFYSVE